RSPHALNLLIPAALARGPGSLAGVVPFCGRGSPWTSVENAPRGATCVLEAGVTSAEPAVSFERHLSPRTQVGGGRGSSWPPPGWGARLVAPYPGATTSTGVSG